MSKMINYRIIFFLLLMLVGAYSSVTFGATYFMRADGKATNKSKAVSCSSASSAMSVKTHNKETFKPGDIIQLCDDGGVYKSSIIAPSSGSEGKPITYRNADGDTPVINLSKDIGSSGWKDMGGGVYQKRGQGRVLWEDDVPLKAASNETLKDGNWYYPIGSGKLYYRPTNGSPSDHSIQTIWFDIVWAPYAIDLRNKSNMTVHGLTVKRVGGGIGHGSIKKDPVSSIKNIIIHNNTISECMWGIWSEVYDNGIESDVRIYNNNISYCNSGISSWTGSDNKPGHTQYHKRYTVTGNQILNLYSITKSKVWSDALLTSYYYTDHEGISFQDVQDSIISDNIITTTYSKDMTSDQYWCRAIYLYLTNGDVPTTGNKILRNKITGHYYPSIYVSTYKGFEGFEKNIIAYNSIHYSLSDKGHITFIVNTATDNPLSGKNHFINNTIVNDIEGLAINFNNKMGGAWVIKNNIIQSPSRVNINDNNSGGNLTFDHNIYPDAEWGFQIGTEGMTFKTWTNKYKNDVLGSSTLDPKFVSKNNFHLKSESPAIDAGQSLDIGMSKDIERLPISGKPDIGAYELQHP